jgi:hypothetical protein
MGVEAFGVSIEFTERRIIDQVLETLIASPEIRVIDQNSIAGFNTVTAEFHDGIHFIEFQVSEEIETSKCTAAIRFALCSFPSVDAIFLNIVKNLLQSFKGDVWLMTSAVKQKGRYSAGDDRWLIAALPREIEEMRKYWQKLFGPKQGAVRVRDSFTFVGIAG